MTEVCLVIVWVWPGSSGDTLPDQDAGGQGPGVTRQLEVSTKHQNWFYRFVIRLNRNLIHSKFPLSLPGNSGDNLSRGVPEVQNKVCLSYPMDK